MSSSFDKKLREFEVAPPAHAWQRIETALNEIEPELQIGYKLYEAETAPPPNTWNNVSRVLELDSGATVIPLGKESSKRRINLFYRYAAAAVLLGALVIGALTLTDSNTPAGTDVAAAGPEPATPSQTLPDEEETVITNNLPEENSDNSAIIPEDRSMIASAVTSPRTQYQGSTVPSSRNESFAYQPANLHHELEAFSQAGLYNQITRPTRSGQYDPEQTTKVNRYLIILTPDGQVIRMSPKFVDMIGCLYSGETPEDEWCREQIALWRQKMASAQLTPSPDNFMDILTLISSLQDQ